MSSVETPQSAAMAPRSAAAAKAAERASALTVKTLEKLDALHINSTPEFYELWFRYFEGEPAVVRAIDALEGAVDEAACLRIYTKLLSTSVQDTAVNKVSDQVQSSIAKLVTMLKSANAATTEYGGQLDTVQTRIKGAATIDDLAGVVAEIIEDTQQMVKKNKALETELVNSSQQVTELRQYLETAKKEATTDGLTGIANRKAFDRAMVEAIETAQQAHGPVVLMLLDIDHFKKFNDTYGHPMGDQVLKLVARTLVSNVKGQDTTARYGGEEFAIILPGTPLKAGQAVAETLRRSVESKEITNKSTGQKLGAITISIGVAQYRSGEDISSLIERADAALYKAKAGGRNQVFAAGV
jgi:diguanylate cyclase